MSVEKAKEFLFALKEKTPDDALIEKMKSVKSDDDRLQLYAEIAGPMGYDLTGEEIKEAISELDAEHKAKTQAAKREMEALDDDELENVSGGNGDEYDDDDECEYDFVDTDCALTDACALFNIVYFGCDNEYY